MQGQIRQLQMSLGEEQKQRLLLQAQLSACIRRLDKLDPPESPMRMAVRHIEMRGNVRLNQETGQVALLRRLDFQPRTTKDEPSAVFRDPDTAEAICKDLAELSNVFRADMTIEGHTKGGESDFWQTLANGRARIVAEAMIDFGANPNLLHTRGLPGRVGNNEVKTAVYMDLRNVKDEDAVVQEVDVTQAGRVVERDTAWPTSARVIDQDSIRSYNLVQPTMETRRFVSRPSSPRTVMRTV
jgi:hypothetical protein